MTTVFNVKENLMGVLNTKLAEANLELADEAKKVLVDFLLQNGVLTVDKVIDLDGFTHYEIQEGDPTPTKSLLLNHFIVYLFEGTRTVRAHEEEYNEYLEDNELFEDEYPYDQFLRDNELVETFPTVTYYTVSSVNLGDTYLFALREKEEAAKRLEMAERTIEKLQPIISANFLPLA